LTVIHLLPFIRYLLSRVVLRGGQSGRERDIIRRFTMRKINIAHSPDSDDAFMFYALATDKIETGDLEFVHHLEDIESLNRAAQEGRYEVTAVSIHAYAYLHETYALLNSGASMGEGYGPIVVASTAFDLAELSSKLVGIPGTKTSAFLALKLFQPDFEHVSMSFDQILPAVMKGEIDAGLVIHEGQLSYREQGLVNLLDLGVWWKDQTGLPLPLGGNVVRRDLGSERIALISSLLSKSIHYALSHREEVLEYALQFGRGLDPEQGDLFVSMYVNDRTRDYGEDGQKAVQLLLDKGYEQKIIPNRVDVEFF
jgi:1,4-dihydroxy-6-naphthoate synthase